MLSNILHHFQINIGFIQECHFHANKKVRIDGYNFIHDNSAIGVAVGIKNTILFNKIDFSGIRLNNYFIQIELYTNNTTQEIHEDMNKVLRLTNSYNGFIIGGDLNTKSSDWRDLREC